MPPSRGGEVQRTHVHIIIFFIHRCCQKCGRVESGGLESQHSPLTVLSSRVAAYYSSAQTRQRRKAASDALVTNTCGPVPKRQPHRERHKYCGPSQTEAQWTVSVFVLTTSLPSRRGGGSTASAAGGGAGSPEYNSPNSATDSQLTGPAVGSPVPDVL